MSLGAVSMGGLGTATSPFVIVVGLAFLALLVAGWLILRARKPMRLPALDARLPKALPAADAARATAGQWAASALRALRYLSTRQEWRYQIPWVMMLGETGAGKTSVAASVTTGRRQNRLLREQNLAVDGTEWRFFNRGVVIDPAGALSSAAPDSGDGRRWQQILGQLDRYRPERPLDALVLVVSARTLLRGTLEQRQALADGCYRQLWALQKRFEFAFPVYVIVSQNDAIDGFSAFWSTQPAARRGEMLGWSNPYLLDGASAGDWADAAFEHLEAGLRDLQVEAAATLEEIPDADRFFLFPLRFQALKAPLRAFLEVVFQPSAYHASFFFRGIYFTGSVVAAGDVAEGVREDVAFVDGLFEQKVFAETNLARPTREGVWSRNRLIRRVQVGAIGVLAGLCVALTLAGIHLNHQVDALISSHRLLKEVRRDPGRNEACIGKETVYDLLSNISKIDAGLTYWAIPMSWADSRVTRQSARLIAESAFQRVIFPSMSCQLEQRARQLMAYKPAAVNGETSSAVAVEQSRRQLQDYVEQVRTFERNLAMFKRIAAYASREHSDELLPLFGKLAEYLYGEPLPATVENGTAYRNALASVVYKEVPYVPPRMRERVAGQIDGLAAALQREMAGQLAAGAVVLDGLSREQEPILGNAKRFEWWLAWVRKEWLDSTEDANPCRQAAVALDPVLGELRAKFHYPAQLGAVAERFSGQTCYRPAMKTLAELHVAPYGPVFQRGQGTLELAPAIAAEEKGISALVGLDFLQLTPHLPFSCQAAAIGWRPQSLTEAERFIREYQAFVRRQGLDTQDSDPSTRPLYDRLARRQLHAVLDEIMAQGQVTRGAAGPLPITGVDAVSAADRELGQSSEDFKKALDPLLQVLRLYQQLGYDASQARIVQCTRDFAADALHHVDALADASRLYDPAMDTARSGSGADPFFALGGTVMAKDYLARQRQRGQVLAGYAAPFVAFLKNTDAVDEAHLANEQTTAYWDNTIDELNRYVQFKEPNGQVAHLDNFFLKQLGELTGENCSKVLAAYQPEGYGNDLFSQRRRAMTQQARLLCTDRRQAEALAQYRELADRFNRELAGHYPFVDRTGRYPFGDSAGREARPATVKTFFANYETQREGLRQALSGLTGERWRRVKEFIDQLDGVAAFFRSSLTAGDASQPLRLDVTFRALPKHSPGSEQVVEWALTAGQSSALYPNGQATLDWPFGELLLLDLTWADRSRFRPISDGARDDMKVEGATASFVALGQWALLRFVEAHRPRQVPSADPMDPSRVLLEFVVPVAGSAADGVRPAQAARMYLALKLSGVDPKTQARVAVRLPTAFPQSAPVIW